MARTVYLQEKDGSVTPIIVEGEYTDEQVSKRYGLPLLSTRTDIVKAAQAGAVKGAEGWIVGPQKASVGAVGSLGNLIGGDVGESIKNRAREGAKNVQRMEGFFQGLGGDYVPATKVGEYVRAGAAGAIQPGSISRLPINMAIGAIAGTAGQGAHDLGLGELGVAGASMAPWLALALKQGLLTPASGYRKAREAVEALTPEQQAAITLGMTRGREAGVDPMIWQVAPETSQLRHLGLGATQLRGAEGLQRRVMQQVPPQPNAATQGSIARVMDPIMDRVSAVPVGPGEAEFIRQQVAAVGPRRSLPASDTTGQAVAQQANRIGNYVEQRVPQQQLLNELQTVNRAKVRLNPGDPQFAPMQARVQEIQAILGGTAPWPTTRVFQPNVRTVGEVNSIRQNMGGGEGNFATAPQGAQIEMQQAVRDAVDAAVPVAGYGPALQRYGEVADAVRSVEQTAGRTAGRVVDPMHAASRTEAGPEVLYAAATNPAWAMVRPAYRMAENANAKILDKLMQSNSVEELARRAAKDPRNEALISALRALIAPLQQGTIDYEQATR